MPRSYKRKTIKKNSQKGVARTHCFATEYKIPLREVSDYRRVPLTTLRRKLKQETGEIPSKTVFDAERERVLLDELMSLDTLMKKSLKKVPGYVHSLALKIKLYVLVTWNQTSADVEWWTRFSRQPTLSGGQDFQVRTNSTMRFPASRCSNCKVNVKNSVADFKCCYSCLKFICDNCSGLNSLFCKNCKE